MKKLSVLLMAGLFSLAIFAQNDPRIAKSKTPLAEVPVVQMPHLDNQALLAAEMERRGPGIAPKFAEAHPVNISPATHGHWDLLANGNALWRLRIRSGGAKSLNLGFTKYLMPAGGSLILYDPSYQTVLGPFTPADNEEHEQLWTPNLPGDEMVVEVQLPAHSQSALQLDLQFVNHAFVGFDELASGSCNLDVICGEADNWGIVDNYRDIIQSVARIFVDGQFYCTGFLVNNARQDCTPYFITANHCEVDATNAASVVFYWNYYNSTCRQPGSPASGGNGNGPTNITNTGAIFKAASVASDFTLVELDDPIPAAADAFFAGWSAEDFAPTDSVITIHHPSGDEKRISFEFQPTFVSDYNGATPNPNGTHITVADWDIGTTEGGSSGAPLFNREKQVVGQLHGGFAACGNNELDSYGWFYRSWTGGGAPSNRLKDWLDPDNTGIVTLNGRSPNQCSFFVNGNPANQSICAPADVVYSITVSPSFLGQVALSINNLPAGLTASFGANPVAPGATTTLTLSNTAALAEGSYTLALEGNDGNESTSTNLLFFVASQIPLTPLLTFPANGASTGLSPNFTWTAIPTVQYTIEIAADADFTNIVTTASNLTGGNYAAAGDFAPSTTYYWRVRGENICGQGNWPASPHSFTTGAIFCAPAVSSNVPITIPSSGTPTITSTLTVANGGNVDDINVVNLSINHTWVGDLQVELISPSGTTVALLYNPGNSDCGNDNIQISLDDEATATNADLNAMCNPVPPAIFGTFQPLAPLSDFNGEPANGVWTLKVHDIANQDGGTLVSWGLDLCSINPDNFSVSPSAGSYSSCLGSDLQFNVSLGTAFDDSTGVTLTAENLPAGASAVFSPNPAPPGALVAVTISGAAGTGSSSFDIIATDGLNNSGNTSVQWEIVTSPAAPTAIFPSQNGTDIPLNPIFNWTATGANSYQLILSENPNISVQNAILIVNPTQSSYAPPTGLLTPCTTYYWTLGATNNCGVTAPGSVFSFTTEDVFTLAINPGTVTLCGTGTGAATLHLSDCFEDTGVTLSAESLPPGVEVSFSPNPAPPGSNVDITITSNSLPTGAYTFILSGDDGTNTAAETLDLNVTGPAAAPVFVAPANLAVDVNVLTAFDWNVVAGASSYNFQLATDINFSNIVADFSIAQTAYTMPTPLDLNTTYYWRVTAYNNCGGTTPAPFSFTTWEVNGVNELNGLTVSISPNPTSGLLGIRFSKPTHEHLEASLFSVNGILLKKQAVQIGSKSTTFDLSELPAGLYLLQLKTGSAVLTEKVILEK